MQQPELDPHRAMWQVNVIWSRFVSQGRVPNIEIKRLYTGAYTHVIKHISLGGEKEEGFISLEYKQMSPARRKKRRCVSKSLRRFLFFETLYSFHSCLFCKLSCSAFCSQGLDLAEAWTCLGELSWEKVEAHLLRREPNRESLIMFHGV